MPDIQRDGNSITYAYAVQMNTNEHLYKSISAGSRVVKVARGMESINVKPIVLMACTKLKKLFILKK